MSVNVLIVDDSEVTRTVVRRMLNVCGLPLGEVHEASNGKLALEVLGKSWVDVILVDINMPQMNGFELIGEMKKNDLLLDTPVVVISSERRLRQIGAMRRLGVRAYLTKPLRPEQLREVLGEIMGGVDVT